VKMSVRIKTVVAITLTLLGLLLILYLAYSSIVARNVSQLESESTSSEVDRVLASLNDDIARLNTTVGDWAPWDDTYQFALDGNPEYIESNLTPSTLSNLDLNLIAIVDNSGQLIYGTNFDLVTASMLPQSASFTSHLQNGSHLLEPRVATESLTGILMLAEGPMFIAAQPILTSDASGPSHGTLFMGRWLNAAVIADLAYRTHLTIDVFPITADKLPDDVVQARDSLSSSAIVVDTLSEEVVAGYIMLMDVYGQPALILRIESPRIVYTQGKESRTYFILALLLSGITFGLATVVSIERVVLTRLSGLNQRVRHIGKAGDLATRVEVNGRDEISALADSVNSMLGSLELSWSRERESQERYRAVVEQTSEGIFLCDANTKRMLEANPAFLGLLGYTLEELLALNLYDVIEDSQAQPDLLSQTLLSQESDFMGERPYRRKDGSAVWVEMSANVIRLGNRLVICAVVRDITQRKQTALELAAKNEEIKATTQQLWHAARLATLGELAANMAHELNNPLQTVSLHVEALLVDIPADDTHRAHLQVVEQETERMATLVANLLQFSRRSTQQVSSLDLQSEIDITLDLIQAQFHRRQIAVAREFAPDLPLIHADRQQLRQVFINLFTNASDAMPTGGTLTIRVTSQEQQIVIEMADTGQGIATEDLPKIMEPFFTTKPEGEGTGLGLAICRRIVQEHGGSLTITSEGLGQGATVLVCLPAPQG
jgi:PAS domain S-box-containing protein